MHQTPDNICQSQTAASAGRGLASPTGAASSAGGDSVLPPPSSPSHDGLIRNSSSTINDPSPAPTQAAESYAPPTGGSAFPVSDTAPQDPQAGSTASPPTYTDHPQIRESNIIKFFAQFYSLEDPTQGDHIPLMTPPPSNTSSLKVEPDDTTPHPGLTSTSGPPCPPQSPWSLDSNLLYVGQAAPLLSDQYSVAQNIDYSVD
ncbi:uncharacterized protein DNG_00133 [Cephalotrichum gorgonifer]|uniref:Uncharacterized protein n=1 Tax=Cephalotrichum gorgonifer TaxID=2041049 RepID=A0AAE8MPG1_9PEZI|nr:uncharacterized protein DNG_00133 [Cephalotrichum gorgonifer]